jgi:Na+-transporting NADH:ubiquinone oxidoreductase subunit F
MWTTLSAFALPVFTVAGLTTVLAALILLAERFLTDYGEVDLLINNEKKLRVRAGNTLLNTLKQEKIFIPSACGGRATCAYCKVKVNSGFGDVLPTEEPLLSPEEIARGVRLSCQVKVKTDVSITVPEALFKIKEYRVRLDKVADLTYDIKWFRFRLIEPDSIEYLAGQYIQFQAPEYGENSQSVYRAYSMCGRASEKGFVELMVRLVPGGIATTYLFHHLAVGGEATVSGPYGDFYLRNNPGRMLCVAGGSGMAPIRSILLEMSRDEIARRRPLFFFGARAVRDLFMVDEWREFEKNNPGFKFLPALSQPDPEDRWDGLTGRITDVIADHVENASDCDAYLCGGPGMLNACVAVLKDLGMSEDRIYYDKFE